ncbi:phage tail protein [Pseudomonas sp. AL03]|uniref:phage tail protein n=1 Tax=Pseudomonas sp. AL03 TaxID=3042230 RepID=UPI00249AEF9A|nr:phage tail protein [Pseudomonas sp. AL03]MDI3274887.1 phage tail protein [Pseudomonas sp. AL03]
MPWYKAGTVSVTQNSNAVIGSGTAFIANSRVGDGFRGPDGGWYEVTNIASDTAMSISPPYQGATNAAGVYALAPLQGYVKDSADALRALVNQFGSQLAALTDTDGLPEGPTNKYFTDARVRDAVLLGFVTTDSTPVVAADSVLAGFGKLQAQVTDRLSLAGGKMTGAINAATPVPLASAATVDIGAVASNVVTISGTTAITGFGAIAAGALRTVRFTGALVLTYNVTSMILPTAANITTAPNDTAEFLSLGAGNWICLSYIRANGKALAKDFAYDRTNIVGTVSDSGGLPNGAAFESGIINATRYVKLADGSLFQYKTVTIGGGTVANGNVFKSLSYDMGLLAVSPVGDWVVASFGISQAAGGGWAGQQTFGAAGTWGTWSAYSSTAVTGSITISLVGIGRWKT